MCGGNNLCQGAGVVSQAVVLSLRLRGLAGGGGYGAGSGEKSKARQTPFGLRCKTARRPRQQQEYEARASGFAKDVAAALEFVVTGCDAGDGFPVGDVLFLEDARGERFGVVGI